MTSLFNLVDVNGDNQVSWTEVYQFDGSQLESNSGFRAASVAPRSFYSKWDQVDLIFSANDFNNDNYLNHLEVKMMLSYSYGAASDSDASWFIDLVDVNGDDLISKGELYTIL